MQGSCFGQVLMYHRELRKKIIDVPYPDCKGKRKIAIFPGFSGLDDPNETFSGTQLQSSQS